MAASVMKLYTKETKHDSSGKRPALTVAGRDRRSIDGGGREGNLLVTRAVNFFFFSDCLTTLDLCFLHLYYVASLAITSKLA